MKPLILRFIKRTLIFIAIWFCVGIVLSLGGISSNDKEAFQNGAGGMWILVGIGIYIWKIWKKEESLLRKILRGILVWLIISSLGIFPAFFGFPLGSSYMLVSYVFLMSSSYE